MYSKLLVQDFRKLFLKILYIVCELIIFFHAFQKITITNDPFIKFFFYFQLFSIFPVFMFFNPSSDMEYNSDGHCPSDEFSFNLIILIKLILTCLIYQEYNCFKYEVIFYYLSWKTSFLIRTNKIHNWSLPEKSNKILEKFFIFTIIIYFILLLFLFRISSIIFFIPIFVECFITMPSMLFKKEPDTVPLFFPIKKYAIVKSKYKKVELSNLAFFQFSILLFWNMQIGKEYIAIISICITIITFLSDNKYRRFFQTKFFKYYSGFFYKCILYIVIFLLQNTTYLLDNTISKTDLITVLIPLLVFNLGAFFILLQFNYQKYSSSFLIKKLINPIIVFISIVLPATILCITCFFNIDFFRNHLYISCIFITSTIISSFILIMYFSFISESWLILNSLLLSTKWTDFENHRDSIFQLNESRIEAIQSIIIADIKNNSVNTIRTDLLALSDWTKNNIRDIAYKSTMYKDIIDNRFIEFYNSIISAIFNKKNPTVTELFFRYFYFRCLNSVTYKDFHKYTIIYDIMFNFVREEIKFDEKNAKLNFSRLLTRCPFILTNLDSNNKLNFEIENHITDNIKSIYDYAIKEKKNLFISKYTCFSDIFSNIDSKQENIIFDINEYIVDFYNEIRSILRELIKNSTDKNNYIKTCIKEIENLSEFLFELDITNIDVRHLWDYHLYTCEQIIKKAQEMSYIDNADIFSPFFDILYKSNNIIFDNTLFLLSKLLDDFFYYLESIDKENYMFSFWYRMDCLFIYYNNNIKQKNIKSFMDVIIEKHKNLKNYTAVIQNVNSNFTKIEDFNYSKLDIRKHVQ